MFQLEHSANSPGSASAVRPVQTSLPEERDLYTIEKSHARYAKHGIRKQAGTAFAAWGSAVSRRGTAAAGFGRVAARSDSLAGDLGVHHRVHLPTGEGRRHQHDASAPGPGANLREQVRLPT